MKRSRRAALATIACSSSVLAVERLGFSSERSEDELTTEDHGFAVDRAYLTVTRRDGVVEHRWRLEGVATGPIDLELFRAEYSGLETETPVDFTDAESLSVSIFADGTEYVGTIEHRTETRVDIIPKESVAIDGSDLELVLTGTGPPAAHDAEVDQPSGATLAVLGGGFDTSVEGIWRGSD